MTTESQDPIVEGLLAGDLSQITPEILQSLTIDQLDALMKGMRARRAREVAESKATRKRLDALQTTFARTVSRYEAALRAIQDDIDKEQAKLSARTGRG